MLRALLVILAILSVVLGVALSLWFMYVAAALLLLAAAGVWLLSLRGKFEIGRPQSAHYAPSEEEDLGALGILEIRPRERTAREAIEVSEQEPIAAVAGRHGSRSADPSRHQHTIFEAEDAVSSAETEIREPSPVEKNGTSREVTSSGRSGASRSSIRESAGSRYQVVSASAAVDRDVVLPCLESLCAALEANTVCLLGSEAGGKGHRIHAMVSRNAYARAGGELTPGNGMRWSSSRYVTVERAADATWDPYDLQYYRETIAVKELAHVAVPTPRGAMRFLLIADSMVDGALSDPRAQRIMDQYAAMLSTLIVQKPERAEDEVPAFRPRREIIEEEMWRAREGEFSIALALVMLNRAEQEDRGVAVEEVEELEGALRQRLEESAEGLRVERFGDLMYGVFVPFQVTAVEDWAIQIQEQLGADFADGASIGAAMLTDRHTTPEQLRADAAAALQEAVKSRVCTILE